MDILNIATVGFFVVFLGTLFLIGELLVKAKGIFAILGIAIMSLYFSFHLSGGSGLWVLLLYIIGLLLIIVDGKAIGDGTVAIIGVLLMIFGLALPSPSILYGVLASMGFLLGGFASLLFIKAFPSRNMWSKMTLKDKLSSEEGYNSMNASYGELLGKQGKAVTPFRPTGTIVIEGKKYSATTENQWLEQGTDIKVVAVDGTKIVVKKVE